MNQHGKQINHVSTQFTSLGQLNTLFPEHADHATTALRIEIGQIQSMLHEWTLRMQFIRA